MQQRKQAVINIQCNTQRYQEEGTKETHHPLLQFPAVTINQDDGSFEH